MCDKAKVLPINKIICYFSKVYFGYFRTCVVLTSVLEKTRSDNVCWSSFLCPDRDWVIRCRICWWRSGSTEEFAACDGRHPCSDKTISKTRESNPQLSCLLFQFPFVFVCESVLVSLAYWCANIELSFSGEISLCRLLFVCSNTEPFSSNFDFRKVFFRFVFVHANCFTVTCVNVCVC